ncbi:MAG: DUF4405 domain-containing protein [Chloroflexi bacterium]|nr:DUF4405 domain-containing protein [Chloroflexota bacterium]
MRKMTWNYIVDAIFGLLLLLQGIIGFILWFILPGGGYRYRGGSGLDEDGSTFLFARHTWLDIHGWVAVALLVIFALHIAIHWQWIVGMTKSYFGQGKVRE